MKARIMFGGVLVAVIGLTLGAAAAAGPLTTNSGSTLPSASCGPVFYKGSGSPRFIVASDLPLQGAGRAQNLAMQQAIQYVLEKELNFKAGKYTVGYQGCDDSTAQTGAWDAAKCSSNGRAYAADKTVLGVLGTFNSTCSKLILPIINRAAGGALAMLSSANTNVGLTHKDATTSPGEPKIYYPTGVRNYARVAASDDYQGPAGVTLLQSKAFKLSQGKKFKSIRNVFVIHDNQTFGKGVARAFSNKAKKSGLKVLGFVPWDSKATSYEAIGEQIKSSGAQSVYLGGIICNNGVKLVKDLRAVLGPDIVFVGPDGWTSRPRRRRLGGPGLLRQLRRPAARDARPRGQEVPGAVQEVREDQGQHAAVRRVSGPGGADHVRRDRAVGRHACFCGQGDVQDESQERDHGHVGFDKNGDIVPNKWITFDQFRGNTYVSVYAVVTKVK